MLKKIYLSIKVEYERFKLRLLYDKVQDLSNPKILKQSEKFDKAVNEFNDYMYGKKNK